MQKLLENSTCGKHTFFCGEIYLKFVTISWPSGTLFPDISSEKKKKQTPKKSSAKTSQQQKHQVVPTSSSKIPLFLAFRGVFVQRNQVTTIVQEKL